MEESGIQHENSLPVHVLNIVSVWVGSQVVSNCWKVNWRWTDGPPHRWGMVQLAKALHVCIATAQYTQALQYSLVNQIGLTCGGGRDRYIPIDSHSHYPTLYMQPTISQYCSANRSKNWQNVQGKSINHCHHGAYKHTNTWNHQTNINAFIHTLRHAIAIMNRYTWCGITH